MEKFNVEKVTKDCINWTKNWVETTGNKDSNVIIGISGGKDSTVTAAILCKALGPNRVKGILLPCGEQVDIEDSKNVCRKLDIDTIIIDIGYSYRALLNAVSDSVLEGENFKMNTSFTTNTPARIRMAALYGVSALYTNSFVVNTCNLSEDTVGYSTLFGDSAGSFAPISHLTTDEVIAIGDYLGLPKYLTHKNPTDGMSVNDKTGKLLGDEEKLGFTYHEINQLIRDNVHGDNYDKIVSKYKANLFKTSIIQIPYFDPHLDNYLNL